MTYTPTIYSWPAICVPLDQAFRAGGSAIEGGTTTSGVLEQNPEPGGRGELSISFSAFVTEDQNVEASWLISELLNGRIFKIPVWQSVQLVPNSALGITSPNGLTWDNGQAWDTGALWAYELTESATSGLEGSETLTFNTSNFGSVVKRGHVIGVDVDGYSYTHKVSSIIYSGDTATAIVTPPLRRDVSGGSIAYRPHMMVTCVNAREVGARFQSGRHIQLNAAQLREAIL